MLGEGRELISILPATETGKCVIDKAGNLFSGTAEELDEAQNQGLVSFHEGRIHGALPIPRQAS